MRTLHEYACMDAWKGTVKRLVEHETEQEHMKFTVERNGLPVHTLLIRKSVTSADQVRLAASLLSSAALCSARRIVNNC